MGNGNRGDTMQSFDQIEDDGIWYMFAEEPAMDPHYDAYVECFAQIRSISESDNLEYNWFNMIPACKSQIDSFNVNWSAYAQIS